MPWTQASQTAKGLMDLFASDSDLTFFNVSQTTAETATGTAHGLTGTPDFVFIAESAGGIGAGQEGVSWTADGTTLTVTSIDTQAPKTISVIAGNLA